MMKQILCTLFLSCVMTSALAAPQSADLYPFDNPKQEQRFQHLLTKLRCLVCQNQNLIDSEADLAKDLRAKVYHLVKTHDSDDEVIRYLTARYGDFILFQPPLKQETVLLWFGPFAFLLLGLVILGWVILRRNRHEQNKEQA